jgi:TetR/AcrR family transcriptional repressor of lmrAB and yxaGH operons
VATVVSQISADLDKLTQRFGHDPAAALAAWMAAAQKVLEKSGFERGCPLAAVALESTREDDALRSALAEGFSTIRERLGLMLSGAGLPEPKAQSIAALMVSAYEGALISPASQAACVPCAIPPMPWLDLIRLHLPAKA